MLNADAPVTISCQMINRQDGEDVYGGTRRRAEASRVRPAQGRAHPRARAAAAGVLAGRRPVGALVPGHRVGDDDRRRRRPPHRDRERVRRAHAHRARHRQERLPRAGQGRRADPGHEARQLPHVARRARARARRPLPSHARPRARRGRRGALRAAAGVARRVLGALGRAHRADTTTCSRRRAGASSSSRRRRRAPTARACRPRA